VTLVVELVCKSRKNIYNVAGQSHLDLFRCGLSADKPFYYGAYRKGFEYEGAAFDLPTMKAK
jgi:CDGSH-type Zn-finger protein